MQEITKEQYIERINDHERLYLVTTDDHNIYLKADIEYGGEIGLRIEMMDFKLDTSLTFWNACNECRCRYTGGICFIEYLTNRIFDRIFYTKIHLDKQLLHKKCI